MSRAAAKPTIEQRPMSCVSIDHTTYLLPFADGQKLLEIMARAVVCDKRYSIGYFYEVGRRARPELSIDVVMPDQVRKPPAAAAGAAEDSRPRLGHVRSTP